MHTQLGSVESDVVYHMTAEEKFGMHAIVPAGTGRRVSLALLQQSPESCLKTYVHFTFRAPIIQNHIDDITGGIQ